METSAYLLRIRLPRLFLLAQLLLTAAVYPAFAQEMRVVRGNESFALRDLGDGISAVTIDGQSLLLVPQSMIDSLSKKALIQEQVIARHERVIAAHDSLIAAYQEYERSAENHVNTLQALNSVTDSLYTGYESLYEDLKRVVGFADYALIGGLGYMNLPGDQGRVFASVGLGYQRWWGMYQYGFDKGRHGFQIGLRWPFGF